MAQIQGEVPVDLKGCMVAMDHFLSEDEQKKFISHSEDDLGHAYNLSLGSYIRSHWGLNDQSSQLHSFFEERGIVDSHIMSNLILVSYHRVKTNQFINLESQIQEYIGEKQMNKVRKKLKKAGKEF